MAIKELIPLETYYHPDHDSNKYPHWTRYFITLYDDGYQVVTFGEKTICAGFTLEINMNLVNKIQYWGYGKKFTSKEEMEKACKNKAFW